MTLVRTHCVEYVCDKCNKGNMMPTGRATMTHPQRFEHSCQSCQHVEFLQQPYPAIKYEKLIPNDSQVFISN